MATTTEYITRIEVEGLWGRLDLDWALQPDVNILSGQNGSGKTTLIRALAQLLRTGNLTAETQRLMRQMRVTFGDGQILVSGEGKAPEGHNIDIISTFDNHLLEIDAVKQLTGGAVRSELDWELYRVQRRYLSYQLALGKRAVEVLTRGSAPERLTEVNARQTLFFDIVDQMFEGSGKKIDRKSDELMFDTPWGKITPYTLSSGEKQLLLILTTALTEDDRPAILLMDEPEISLHFDWQGCLIENIRQINPRAQIILSTHSPALIMNGWVGHVTEINDLIVNK
ncbi:MAG: AAA family ATPase [Rikenellaceae bacterium]|jgi:predicted ATP-dependent endonuclease of OLD family|nr:AAA family ATPase [Rikenellaceae bacterium]